MSVKIDIITCPEWGARQPKNVLQLVGKSDEIIFHHTAGHHAEIDTPKNESRREAIAYRRAIQNYHMDQNGWDDSGDNFLVCRNGLILQGRWLTVSSIQAGHMVRSAHCPEHNDSIGIEHEHMGDEPMTHWQLESSARLMAWIADQYKRKTILIVNPHKKFFATSCPANLVREIPSISRQATAILRAER